MDEPYDVVLSFNVLNLFTDLNHALDAGPASLKPGGRFVSKTACLREMNPVVPGLLVPCVRALGRAPWVLVFDARQLQMALQRHGTQRKDMRVFIAARKPL